MSKPRYKWWGYVRAMIRDYPNAAANRGKMRKGSVAFKELQAVEQAVRETQALPDGQLHLKLIGLVFWRDTHTLQGAARVCGASYSTAKRWVAAFILAVARAYGLMEKS